MSVFSSELRAGAAGRAVVAGGVLHQRPGVGELAAHGPREGTEASRRRLPDGPRVSAHVFKRLSVFHREEKHTTEQHSGCTFKCSRRNGNLLSQNSSASFVINLLQYRKSDCPIYLKLINIVIRNPRSKTCNFPGLTFYEFMAY